MQGAKLFVRGEECIWLQRSPQGAFDLAMNGPFKQRQHFVFSDECELEQFVTNTEERLARAGWSVQYFKRGEDRRAMGAAAS
jgi:hypothetical protein